MSIVAMLQGDVQVVNLKGEGIKGIIARVHDLSLEYRGVVMDCYFPQRTAQQRLEMERIKNELGVKPVYWNRNVVEVPVLIPRLPAMRTFEHGGQSVLLNPIPFSKERARLEYKIADEDVLGVRLSHEVPKYLTDAEADFVKEVYGRLLQ